VLLSPDIANHLVSCSVDCEGWYKYSANG
jgi:hypothetical protein